MYLGLVINTLPSKALIFQGWSEGCSQLTLGESPYVKCCPWLGETFVFSWISVLWCSEMINAMGEKCLQIWMKGKCWWRLELQKHSLAAVLTENKVFLCVDSQVWQNVLSLVSRIQDGVTFSPSWTVLYKTSMISTCCLKKPRSKLSEKLWSRSAGDSVLSSRCCGL